MKRFHPVTILIFFAAMIIPLMVTENPVYTLVSLSGAIIILMMLRRPSECMRELMGYAVIFAVMAVLNPLFVHRGSTPLFFLNGRAVTLEACIFGVCSSLSLTAAIIWCRSFSLIMTSEKLFCLIGRLSPKISAILMMIMRFIPDMLSQAGKISSQSRISGEFRTDSLTGQVKRIMSVFSALVTWAIESAVQTADSMKARGFELGGRTSCSHFEYMPEDIAAIILSVIACAGAMTGAGEISIEFYPTVNAEVNCGVLTALSAVSAAAYLYPAAFSAVITTKRSRSIRSRRR